MPVSNSSQPTVNVAVPVPTPVQRKPRRAPIQTPAPRPRRAPVNFGGETHHDTSIEAKAGVSPIQPQHQLTAVVLPWSPPPKRMKRLVKKVVRFANSEVKLQTPVEHRLRIIKHQWGQGVWYTVLMNDKPVAHIGGFDHGHEFDIARAHANPDIRGSGLFQLLVNSVAGRYENGVKSAKFQSSRSLTRALSKMKGYRDEGEYHRVTGGVGDELPIENGNIPQYELEEGEHPNRPQKKTRYSRSGDERERAKKVELVVLPSDVPGKKCGTCRYMKKGYCTNKQVDQKVEDKWACKLWDHEGVKCV